MDPVERTSGLSCFWGNYQLVYLNNRLSKVHVFPPSQHLIYMFPSQVSWPETLECFVFFLTSCWSLSHVLHQSFWHLSKMFLSLFVCIVVTPVYEITPSAPSSLLALIRHTVRDDGHRSQLECNVCASICVLPSVMGVLYWIWDSPSHSLKFTPSGSRSVVVYWLLPPSEPHVTSTDCPAQPAPAESESALMLPMRSSPGRTPKLQNKYHLSAYFYSKNKHLIRVLYSISQ